MTRRALQLRRRSNEGRYFSPAHHFQLSRGTPKVIT
jgi:hypothetical protein